MMISRGSCQPLPFCDKQCSKAVSWHLCQEGCLHSFSYLLTSAGYKTKVKKSLDFVAFRQVFKYYTKMKSFCLGFLFQN